METQSVLSRPPTQGPRQACGRTWTQGVVVFRVHVESLNLNSENNHAATQLDPTSKLRAYFPDLPPSNVVHVVVQLPSQQSLIQAGLHVPRVEDGPDCYDYDQLLQYSSTCPYVWGAPSMCQSRASSQSLNEPVIES